MNTTIRRVASVLAGGLLMLAALAGCGGGSGQGAASTSQGTTSAAVETEPATPEADPVPAVPSQEERAAIDAGAFTFELPAYWQGRVETSMEPGGMGSATSSAVVTLPGNRKAELARFCLCEDGGESTIAGDIGSHLVGTVPNGGRRVEVWTQNWPWLASSYGSRGALPDGVSEAELRELVDLSTGGSLGYDEAVSDGQGSSSMAESEYTAAALVPTVVFK